jgi:hypothetical protein
MKLKQIGSIALLAFVGTTGFSGMAHAGGVSETFRDAENALYVTEMAPQQEVTFTYPGTPRLSSGRANACGAVIVNGSTGIIKVDGVNIDTSTLPTQLLPPCGSNGAFSEARTQNFKTSDGKVVVVGKVANSFYGIETPENAVRKSRANACGFVRLAPNAKFTHVGSQQVAINGDSTESISSITQKDAPLCRNGVMYVPTSWLSSPGS